MARRRMFSLDVLETDNFSNMPMSSRYLYFELCMRADDDGFIGAAKKITRMAECNDKDIGRLANAGFIILFDNGVIAIRHWHVNNSIRKDMYKKTIYNYEYSMLSLVNDIYVTTNVTSNVTQDVTCNVSDNVTNNGVKNVTSSDTLGKDRLGKDRTGKFKNTIVMPEQQPNDLIRNQSGDILEPQSRVDENISPQDLPFYESPRIDYKSILDMYHSICTSFPKVVKLTETRKKAIKARHDTYGQAKIQTAFEMAEQSSFLKGGSFSCGFDWIMKESNFVKILEGNYKNKSNSGSCAMSKQQQLEDEFVNNAKEWLSETTGVS